MYGFLNINKPKGWTSFDVIRQLQRVIDVKKMGHTGTLDPLATGVLVVALGEATKLIEFLMKDEKEYLAEVTLGSESDTYDADGEIIKISDKKPTEKDVTNALKNFEGDIDQIPPLFSAIKVKGKRAYELARKGKKMQLESRKVHVSKITLISYEYPVVKIDITCSSGTYIRSIAHDLGEKLGVGGYLSELTRTRVGDFLIKNSVDAFDIGAQNIEKLLISIEKVMKQYKKIELNAEEYKNLSYGKEIKIINLPKEVDIFAGIFDNKLVGMLKKVNENIVKFQKQIHIN